MSILTAQEKRTARKLVQLLRHDPGVVTTSKGWCTLADLQLELQARLGPVDVSDEALRRFVENDDKHRLERIIIDSTVMYRARYGHTIPDVFPDMTNTAHWMSDSVPLLYHGTTSAALPEILKHGILPMQRRFVHLTTSIELARNVGQRHVRSGDHVVVLRIIADIRKNPCFCLWSVEGTDLFVTKSVPVSYIHEEAYVWNEMTEVPLAKYRSADA